MFPNINNEIFLISRNLSFAFHLAKKKTNAGALFVADSSLSEADKALTLSLKCASQIRYDCSETRHNHDNLNSHKFPEFIVSLKWSNQRKRSGKVSQHCFYRSNWYRYYFFAGLFMRLWKIEKVLSFIPFNDLFITLNPVVSLGEKKKLVIAMKNASNFFV